MTASYRWVQWNRHKRVYDLMLAGVCVSYLTVFLGASALIAEPGHGVSPPILLMRALGSLAIILLHIILCIGPLARFTTLAAPLLYNRRHLGVTFFFVVAAHAIVAIGFYGGFGVRNPVSATVDGYATFGSVSGMPFEVFGLLALLVFFVMAATSHDFWLANLGPAVWKSLHTAVYAAYGLVLLHVVFGALQSERSPLYPTLLLGGAAVVGALHVAAGAREFRRDASAPSAEQEWIDVCAVADLERDAGRVVCVRDRERIAVFRHEGGVSAVSNVCAHQGGSLGEGRVVNGCVTCPWHGYQYLPNNGQSPPPYTEKIPTYRVRIDGGRVLVHRDPLPPGTPVEPATIAEDA